MSTEAPETSATIKRWWLLRFRDENHEETELDKKSWIVPLEALGLIVIVVGIVAETNFEGKVSDVDSDIRLHESDKITKAEGEAATATREMPGIPRMPPKTQPRVQWMIQRLR